MTFHCAVQGCHNGSYRLKKWKKIICIDHGVKFGTSDCDCEPPFKLTPFPTRLDNPDMRDKWEVLINREGKTKGPGALLSPSKNQRVCSDHFVDKVPTATHPYPTLNLGYKGYENKVQKILAQVYYKEQEAARSSSNSRTYVKKAAAATAPEVCCESDDTRPATAVPVEDNQHCSLFASNRFELRLILLIISLFSVAVVLFRQLKRLQTDYFTLLFQNSALKNKIVSLEKEIEDLKLKGNKKVKQKKPPKLFKSLITDKNVNYYTGVRTKSLVKTMHDYMKDFVLRRWHGSCKAQAAPRKFRKPPAKFGPKRFLDSIDELLLVLMRLRLGLDLKDLADRFKISESLASKIFTTWIKALAAVLANMLKVPDLETVLATKPTRYRSQKLTNLLTIIDCTEFFIETPQDLALQTCTWSDYKHHNTLKVLVAICPNSYICFVSSAYEGRISDTELTKDCGFLEKLPPRSIVMADKGFTLSLECARLNLGLEIPPGRRGQSQMPTEDVRKTKQIANLRILVEQVIRRLKNFRFLRNELTLSSTVLIDEAVTVCAALCNLKGPIYSD